MLIYRILNIILTPFIILLLLYRILKGKEDRSRVWERFAFTSLTRPKNKKLIWIHAASIGESMSALSLLDKIANNSTNILFTSGTLTSARLLQNLLPKHVIHQFAAIENWFAIRKFLKHWQPDLAIFIESEFWPLILSETSKYCKIISLNTSISDKSYQTWQKFSFLRNAMLKDITLFLPQSHKDEAILKHWGLTSRTHYLGHFKYCAKPLHYDQKNYNHLAKQIGNRPVILFASTHPEEDQCIVEIYQKLSPKIVNSLLCIIAPRYPKRSPQLSSLLDHHKITYALRSQKNPITKNTSVYIADTLGELGLFFKLSPITIMGGTFAHIGGHNIIEPLKLGSIVITGPDVREIKEIHQELVADNAIIHCKTTNQTAKAIEQLLLDQNKYSYLKKNADKVIKSKDRLLDQFVEIIKNEL